METDDDLDMGEFATRMVRPKGAPPAEEGIPEPQELPGATMVYWPRAPQPTEAATPEELGVERELVSVTIDGQRHPIDKRSVVVIARGLRHRLDDQRLAPPCGDPPGRATYWIVDLGHPAGSRSTVSGSSARSSRTQTA